MKKYLMTRISCSGIIKGCDECKDTDFSNGFCSFCGRPLDQKIGSKCNSILGYIERVKDNQTGEMIFKKQGKIHIVCKRCSTIGTI